jgi:hypothetical protein
VLTGPKDWRPEYMKSKTHFKEYRPARLGDRRRGLRATIEPSPDDMCSSGSEDNEASLVRHLSVHHSVSLATTKTETVIITLATDPSKSAQADQIPDNDGEEHCRVQP